MKDQGKMSELNLSSHRYQSSNTVGRMSETYAPQGFLGLSINAKIKTKEKAACEVAPNQGLQRTKSRNLRRRRAIRRIRDERIAALPEDATPMERARALDPKGFVEREAARLRRVERVNRHEAYKDFMKQYNEKYSSHLRLSKKAHLFFCSIYRCGEPFVVLPEQLERFHSYMEKDTVAIRDLSPSINFDHFPNARPETTRYQVSPRPTRFERVPPQLGMPDYSPQINLDQVSSRQFHFEGVPPQLGMPDYCPQSGSLSSCVQAKGAIQTCASEVVDNVNYAFSNILEKVGLPSDSILLAVHLFTFRQPMLSVMAYFFLYVLIRLFIDFCVTIRFVAGCLVGFLLPRPPKKPVSFVDSLFAPQGGFLTPDDGAAFLGIQEKTKNIHSGISKPASASAPGISAIPTMGFSQGLRTAPLKPPKKDPNDGPLNGFGVGI